MLLEGRTGTWGAMDGGRRFRADNADIYSSLGRTRGFLFLGCCLWRWSDGLVHETGLVLIQRLFVYGRLASAEIPLSYVQQLRSRADVGYVECGSISGEVWMVDAASLA